MRHCSTTVACKNPSRTSCNGSSSVRKRVRPEAHKVLDVEGEPLRGDTERRVGPVQSYSASEYAKGGGGAAAEG
ncbi:hypothetical protein FOA52_009393 [Chlamydomonas sp. UWO 241]|nr:hypothetical protein FOA52_009393 [Chlamydomonas sp. UWO 241]